MTFRRINTFLHRWLGLLSGLVVFIVSLTGAMLVFEEDIVNLQKPWLHVVPESGEKLPPSALLQAALSHTDTAEKLTAIQYGWDSRSTALHFRHPETKDQTIIYVNPYTAEVLHTEVHDHAHDHDDFFHLMEEGHIHLWLPESIGRPLVRYGTLVFIVLLITGLIWWYPAKWNRTTRKKSFSVMWRAGWKRLTVDLHNVTGFYLLSVALLLAITGIYFSFDWVGNGMYRLFSGGAKKEAVQFPQAVPGERQIAAAAFTDEVYRRILRDTPSPANLFISLPTAPQAPFLVAVNTYKVSSHATQLRFFDPYTNRELYKSNAETGQLLEDDLAYRIMLYNYNLHLGRIGGTTTKILAFLAAVLCASLPVTGFIIWLNKQKKKRA